MVAQRIVNPWVGVRVSPPQPKNEPALGRGQAARHGALDPGPGVQILCLPPNHNATTKTNNGEALAQPGRAAGF